MLILYSFHTHMMLHMWHLMCSKCREWNNHAWVYSLQNTRFLRMCVSFTRVQHTYIFLDLPACESILVTHFYKSNLTNPIVARMPIIVMLTTCTPKPYEITFLLF